MEADKYLKLLILPLVVAIVIGACVPSRADVPYRNYTYDYWGVAMPAPQAYLLSRIVSGADLGVGDFNNPQDLYVDDSTHQIYIVDSGNNRLVRTNLDTGETLVIQSFQNDGKADKFKLPEGVFVTSDDHIYVADTGNARIVELASDGSFIRVIGPPQADVEGVIEANFKYQPSKLAVDPAGRIYVISKNSYDGLTTFDPDGKFVGFMGAPRVKPSASDLFWFRIATREQKARMALFLPTQFANIDMDHAGFSYVVEAGIAKDDSIKRLNPSGSDVLVRNGYQKPKGDVSYGLQSYLFDINVQSNGAYNVLDHQMGRIFTYDENGWLLYVFGGIGEVKGAFRDPVAVDSIGHDIVVLDRGMKQLAIFSPTMYARYINAALELYNRGLYSDSTEMWRKVLTYNANFDLPYTGIGQALLREGRYEEALSYFKLGNDRGGYSSAFKYYRRDLIAKNLNRWLTMLVLVAVAWIAFVRLRDLRRSRRAAQTQAALAAGSESLATRQPRAGISLVLEKALLWARETWKSLRYSVYVATHPFDGFWALKHERRGTVAAAVGMLVLMALAYIIDRQYTGFIFNTHRLSRLNIYSQLSSVVVPFGLWCVVNWALTTLMDGKGRLKDIFISSAFALLPMILIMIPKTILSNFMASEEGAFLDMLMSLAEIWTVILLIVGNMTIHEYSFGRTIFTGALTLAGMVFALFLGILFFSLVTTMIIFVNSIYLQLIFR